MFQEIYIIDCENELAMLLRETFKSEEQNLIRVSKRLHRCMTKNAYNMDKK